MGSTSPVRVASTATARYALRGSFDALANDATGVFQRAGGVVANRTDSRVRFVSENGSGASLLLVDRGDGTMLARASFGVSTGITEAAQIQRMLGDVASLAELGPRVDTNGVPVAPTLDTIPTPSAPPQSSAAPATPTPSSGAPPQRSRRTR